MVYAVYKGIRKQITQTKDFTMLQSNSLTNYLKNHIDTLSIKERIDMLNNLKKEIETFPNMKDYYYQEYHYLVFKIHIDI